VVIRSQEALGAMARPPEPEVHTLSPFEAGAMEVEQRSFLIRKADAAAEIPRH
jgi:hypothetical protein